MFTLSILAEVDLTIAMGCLAAIIKYLEVTFLRVSSCYSGHPVHPGVHIIVRVE